MLMQEDYEYWMLLLVNNTRDEDSFQREYLIVDSCTMTV